MDDAERVASMIAEAVRIAIAAGFTQDDVHLDVHRAFLADKED